MSLALVSLAVMAAPSRAAEQSEPRQSPARQAPNLAPEAGKVDWGTTTTTYLTIPSWAFAPVDSTTTYDQQCCTPYAIFRSGGTELWFEAPANLPNGAQIVELQLQACDTNATAEVGAFITRQANTTGTFEELHFTTTGDVATPGCTTVTTNVSPPIIVDNAANYYGAEIATTATGDTVKFVGVRIGYRLQVSAAPAVATFPNDVPTSHPFFRFVEALAAAGITGGCAAGAYCPDQAVTRGQMAVFLASALGLHFPN